MKDSTDVGGGKELELFVQMKKEGKKKKKRKKKKKKNKIRLPISGTGSEKEKGRFADYFGKGKSNSLAGSGQKKGGWETRFPQGQQKGKRLTLERGGEKRKAKHIAA